jgi:hypothetical protein
MFIAPAALFGGVFIWMSGGPIDLLVMLDRFIMSSVRWAATAGAAAIEVISKL